MLNSLRLQEFFVSPLREGIGIPNDFLSVDSFNSLLNRERGRSDRTGSEFSLVVLYFKRLDDQSNRIVQTISNFLDTRIRLSDEIGWFDVNSLGILLHNTSSEGACIFLNNVCNTLTEYSDYFTCSVFSYPSCKCSFLNGECRLLAEQKIDIACSSAIHHIQRENPEELPGYSENSDCRSKNGMVIHTLPVNGRNGSSNKNGNTNGNTVRNEALRFADIQAQKKGIKTPKVFQLGELLPILAKPIPKWKRVLDILGASLILLITSPILLLTALLIKWVSPGPIFYMQKRIGYLGNPFTLWKFRTMKVNADTGVHNDYVKNLIQSDTPMKKLDAKKDSRLIPFGKLIRYSSIDELPQLFNVLRGEMSLVGPRPCLPYEEETYLRWHKNRFFIIPGLTGLWQINGKNRTTFKEMIRMDISYIRNMSLWLDLKIILMTIPAIIGSVNK